MGVAVDMEHFSNLSIVKYSLSILSLFLTISAIMISQFVRGTLLALNKRKLCSSNSYLHAIQDNKNDSLFKKSYILLLLYKFVDT